MLTILGKSSSINVRKLLWLCAEIDLPYTQEQWGEGFRSTRAPEFLALNPNATVPVINDDGFVLWESNAICRYLASQYQRPDLLPDEPQARGIVEQWMDWQSSELNGAWRYAFMGLVRNSPEHGDAAAIRTSVEHWTRRMALLDGQLSKTGAYVTGSTFTLADIGIGLSVNRWFMTPIERPTFAAVTRYFERLSERPGFRLYGRNGTP